MVTLNQGQEFLCYFVVGSIISFIFDIFKSSRYVFKTNDIITHIEDIVFLIISFILVAFSIFQFSNGVLRFYIVLGIAFGSFTYTLTLSKLCVIIFKSIFKAIKFVINKISEIHL